MQRVQKTFGKVSVRKFDLITDEELNEALLYVLSDTANQLIFDPKAPALIEFELERRRDEKPTKLAEKNLFWQKWGFLISIGIALLALIVAIFSYFKPK